MTEPATFSAASGGADALFFMRGPRIARRRVSASFLDAAAAAGVRRMVALSVLGADRNLLLPHLAPQNEFRARPVGWTILRLSDFMQNLETAHRRSIRERSEVAVSAERSKSAFIDLQDVGAVAAHVLATPVHEECAYGATGLEALDLHHVVTALSETLRRLVRHRPVGPTASVRERRRDGDPFGLPRMVGALYTLRRLGRPTRGRASGLF